MNGFSWAYMIGGLALFFFGLDSARKGLQLAAGEKLRLLLGRLTYNRFFAVALGALLTIILQSSSATTVILVSFAETQLLSLTQAFGVILGAGIGTTLVVVLLSFNKITQYALLLIALGLAVEKIFKIPRVKYIGTIIMGFGMIFFGMFLMSSAAIPLRESEAAVSIFQFLADHPFWNLLFATLFTGIIQASAATIGLAIALTYSGTLPFEACIPIVLGANVGTCVTAALSCFGMGMRGRQVAIAHVGVKIVGAAIVFPFISNIADWIDSLSIFLSQQTFILSLATAGKIALVHLLFNIFLAIIFLPLISPCVLLIQKMFPIKQELHNKFKSKYLDEGSLETPSLAFAQAKSEIMRIMQIARSMFKSTLKMFRMNVDFDEILERIASDDDRIDIIEKEIRFFLSKVSQKSLTESQATTQLILLTMGGEIEAIGDIISKDITPLAKKKRKKLVRFSEQGWGELERLHYLISENFDLTVSMMIQPHADIIKKIDRHEKHLNEMEQELKQSHLLRLHDMLPETYETSTIHLELLGQLRMVNVRLTKIARAAVELK